MILLCKILYNLLLLFGLALGVPVIIPVILVSKRWRRTFLPRLGLWSLCPAVSEQRLYKPGARPIWIHAVSVGEILSIEPLVKNLKRHFNHHAIVLTTTTQTGFTIAQNRLAESVAAIGYFPFDLPVCVKRTIRSINPVFVLIVEHDIWPNFLFELQRRHIPVMLVNARLSQKTFARRQRLSFFMKTVFATFSAVCVQSPVDAERFTRLGVPSNKITLTGSVKFDPSDAPLAQVDQEQFKHALNLHAAAKIFVAGSTHRGEEAILVEVFLKLKKEVPELILIVAPRDPKRARVVCQLFKSAGCSAVLMQEVELGKKSRHVDVIVIDVLGILKKLYAIADIAFVGGSFVKRGGHNPIEPAAYSKPILFGPDMSNFAHISHQLEQAEGAIHLNNADHFYAVACMLFNEPDKARKMGINAFNVFQTNRGAVEKTLNVIKNCLEHKNLLIN